MIRNTIVHLLLLHTIASQAIPRMYINGEIAKEKTTALSNVDLITVYANPAAYPALEKATSEWQSAIEKDMWILHDIDKVHTEIGTILAHFKKSPDLAAAKNSIDTILKAIEDKTKSLNARMEEIKNTRIMGDTSGIALHILQSYIIPVAHHIQDEINKIMALTQATKKLISPSLTYPATDEDNLQIWKKQINTWEELLSGENLMGEAHELGSYILELKKDNDREHVTKRVGHYLHALRRRIKRISHMSPQDPHNTRTSSLIKQYIIPVAEKAQRQLEARES